MMNDLFYVFLVVGIGMSVARFLFRRMRAKNQYHSYLTLEEYQQRHPHLVEQGAAKCFECQGSSIDTVPLGRTFSQSNNIHICRHCGIKLYRSESAD
uniref:hypothetical protein n=1 Tax=Thaumasiovibrio occultus TaxID=1891184 RepID=UPI000B35AF48|nr:hypothetical protein [Thaumasiovibrio occultus]